MGTIYSLDPSKNLFIYASNSEICLRSAISHNLSRPVTLSQDYNSSLSTVIFHDTVYYCYLNTNNDILVKKITDPAILYQKSSQTMPDCFSPQLAVLEQALFLFYFVKNPLDDTYVTKCVLPLDANKTIDFDNYTFTALPKLQIHSLPQELLLLLGDTQLLTCLSLKSDLQPVNLPLSIASHTETSLAQLRDSYAAEQAALIAQHQEELSQTIASFQDSLNKREQLIQSIKSQYEELMHTAVQYREEAKKWRTKYLDVHSL